MTTCEQTKSRTRDYWLTHPKDRFATFKWLEDHVMECDPCALILEGAAQTLSKEASFREDSEAPLKMQACPECDRQVPANWSIPFCQIIQEKNLKCYTCLDRVIGPRGMPLPRKSTE